MNCNSYCIACCAQLIHEPDPSRDMQAAIMLCHERELEILVTKLKLQINMYSCLVAGPVAV